MKRFIAIMLCVISILSVLPISALAAEDNYLWAQTSIEWSIQNKVTSARTVADFNPSGTLTRAQVFTFLYAYKGKPSNVNATNPFCDVRKSDYFYDAAIWAYKNGYASGSVAENGNRSFMPTKICTYAEIVTMLYAVAGKPSFTTTQSFPYTNVTANDYYYVPLKWCAANNIMESIPNNIFPKSGKFKPKASCTRAIFVTLLHKFYQVDTKTVNAMVSLAEYECKYMSDSWNHGIRYGGNGEAWCAYFTSWCAKEKGLASSDWSDPSASYQYPVLRNSYAYDIAQQFAYDNKKGDLFMSSYAYYTNSQYSNNYHPEYGVEDMPLGNRSDFENATVLSASYAPRRGDIVFFGTKYYSISHVGIVRDCVIRGNSCTIYTVEGNCDDAVKFQDYTYDMTGDGHYDGGGAGKWIVGFGRIR